MRPMRLWPIGLVAHPHEQVAHERKRPRPDVRIDRRDRGVLVVHRAGEQHVEFVFGHRAMQHAPPVGPGFVHDRAFTSVGCDFVRPPRDV